MNFNIEPPYEVMDPDQPWYGKGRPGGVSNTSNTWKELWWKLTGKTKPGGGSYVSTVKLSGPDAELLISNMQKDTRGYPQFNESGVGFADFYDALSKYQNWLVEQYLTPEKEIIDTTQAIEEEAQAEEDEIVEEIEDNLEEASEVAEQKIEEVGQETEDLTDIVNLLPPTLLAAVNQRLGTDYEKEKKEPKKSTSVTNNRILKSLTENLTKIQGQLDLTNKLLGDQNDLLRSNLAVSVQYLDQIQVNDGLLESKFDAILDALRAQAAVAEQQADDLETANAERDLENMRDAAGTEGFDDLTKGRKGGGGNGILKYLKRKLLRRLYRRLPRRVRRLRTRARRIQRAPGRLASRARTRLVNRFAPKLTSAASRISAGRSLSKLPKAGPLKYALAGVEYADRKSAGQTNVQAISGLGAGFAGAAAGGAAGAKAGAAIGALFGGVGAAPGAVIGGLLGSVLGGMAGGGISDKVTGANYEMGTPQSPMLGAVDPVLSMVSPVAGMLLGVTQSFMRYSGGSMPEIQKEISTLSSTFGMSSTLVRPDLGGTYSGVGTAIKSAEKKGDDVENVQMSAEDEKVLEELDNKAGPDNFFRKLMRFFGIQGQNDTNVIDHSHNPGSPGATGDSGLTPSSSGGVVQDRPWNTGIKLTSLTTKSGQTFQVASILANQFKGFINDLEATGYKINVIGGWRAAGTGGGTGPADPDYDKNRYSHPYGASIDINPTKNPYGSELITDMPDNIGEIAAKHGLGWGGSWSSVKDAMHFSAMKREGGSKDFDIFDKPGPAFRYGGDVGLSGQEKITVGEDGPEIVMKNLVYETKPIYDMLTAYNASTNTSELISATKRHAPEILMYDEEMEQEATSIIIMNVGNQQPMTPQPAESSSVEAMPHTRITAARTMVLNSLY